MTDISIIILQKNEVLHIKRCLERLMPLEPRQVFVVDCFSTDGSDRIAQEMGAAVVYHEWPGNQAAQFNWALDNLKIETEWILRVDADEYLTEELIREIAFRLPLIGDGTDGIILKRRLYFRGKWVRHGIYPTRILRLFRKGKAQYNADMAMDEHLLVEGGTLEFEHDFVDESLISFELWKSKHCDYAEREAKMVLNDRMNGNKHIYYRCPPYFRAFAYFCYRYFIRLGFLDGYAGWQWNFWQGLWYRWTVDSTIRRMKREKRNTTDEMV